MKLIVQIPCYNEEQTLPATFEDIPKTIDGIDIVEIMIIDDGSTDKTIEVAKKLGVHHIVVNKCNRGLARTFRTGLNECLKLGADIIVNTDGDNQYAGWDIPKLIQPILDGKADVVVGDRNTSDVAHFSPLKKLLQKVGSSVVRRLSGVRVPDAVSGFRAYSREAALQLNIVSPFSYTIEALIQAGKKHMAVASVPVETNAKTRESRLFKSIPQFIERQVTTIVRMYTMYQPLKVFFFIGLILSTLGLLPILRFMYFYFTGDGSGHIQSLVIGGTLFILGIITFLIALLADLMNFNRQLIEQTLEKVKRIELEQQKQLKK
ncbi:glycosyltransferase family 2 protein [Alteromonadaceae bacterium BrNp21-10]|nr:glycosyltransferase family 2 protein [Alteromonadaceae bacterium BrNp21-10]